MEVERNVWARWALGGKSCGDTYRVSVNVSKKDRWSLNMYIKHFFTNYSSPKVIHLSFDNCIKLWQEWKEEWAEVLPCRAFLLVVSFLQRDAFFHTCRGLRNIPSEESGNPVCVWRMQQKGKELPTWVSLCVFLNMYVYTYLKPVCKIRPQKFWGK